MLHGNPYENVTVEALHELDRELSALSIKGPSLARITSWLRHYQLDFRLRIVRVEETAPALDTGTMTTDMCC